MGRSGYCDDWDCDQWAMIRWRGAVESALKGKRGQAFLKELVQALDALPEKKLIDDKLISEDGSVCALGAVGKARSLDMSNIDPHDPETVSSKFGIALAMAREIEYMNDEWFHSETPEQRFDRMRHWAVSYIKDGVK
jgi:hypothetical protein